MHNFTFPNAKILVVDDEPSNVRLLERILDLAGGFSYRCTTDPREAVPLFAEFQPDLVLTDLSLPGPSGLELVKVVRSEYPDTVVVVITAYATVETAVEAMNRPVLPLNSGANDDAAIG